MANWGIRTSAIVSLLAAVSVGCSEQSLDGNQVGERTAAVIVAPSPIPPTPVLPDWRIVDVKINAVYWEAPNHQVVATVRGDGNRQDALIVYYVPGAVRALENYVASPVAGQAALRLPANSVKLATIQNWNSGNEEGIDFDAPQDLINGHLFFVTGNTQLDPSWRNNMRTIQITRNYGLFFNSARRTPGSNPATLEFEIVNGSTRYATGNDCTLHVEITEGGVTRVAAAAVALPPVGVNATMPVTPALRFQYVKRGAANTNRYSAQINCPLEAPYDRRSTSELLP